ncbi:hypothetical protein HUS23_13915 [Ectothiorhodospiraceae bacterium 2226]|nr:hypothetical protein HUS23_13915 [Ectothiorhodospiraceae bacterium 2226]
MQRKALRVLGAAALMAAMGLSGCALLTSQADSEQARAAEEGTVPPMTRRQLWEEMLSYSESLSALPPEARNTAHVQTHLQATLDGAAADYAARPEPIYLLRYGLLVLAARADEDELERVRREIGAYIAQLGLAGEHSEWLVTARLLHYILGEHAAARVAQRELREVHRDLTDRIATMEQDHAAERAALKRENDALRERMAAQEAEFNDKLEQLRSIERQLHERTGAEGLRGLP